MKNKLLLFLFFILLFLSFLQNVNAGVNIYENARTLPESKIIGQTGDAFRLSDFKGDLLLAHFWSRDCGPCIKELKSLNAFHNEVKDDNIRLILISPQSEWFDMNEQRLFLKRYGAPDVEFYVEENNENESTKEIDVQLFDHNRNQCDCIFVCNFCCNIHGGTV